MGLQKVILNLNINYFVQVAVGGVSLDQGQIIDISHTAKIKRNFEVSVEVFRHKSLNQPLNFCRF